MNNVNNDLEKIISAHKTVIKVIGVGGAGCNTLTRLSNYKIPGIETLAINTDAQDLLAAVADEKLLIGQSITKGLGAGSDCKIGEESAAESQEKIKKLVEGCELAFITCGLGGGTGTGAAPFVADLTKSLGALTISFVTMPFREEGNQRYQNALTGLENLRKNSDTIVVLENDSLIKLVPDASLQAAFTRADELLVNSVKGITGLVSNKGLVNLDFADIRSVMQNGGNAMIGIGESNAENKASDAVEKAMMNELLNVDIDGAHSALVNVTGDEGLSISEAKSVLALVEKRLDPQAKITWGLQVDKELKDKIHVLLIVTGLKGSKKKTLPRAVQEETLSLDNVKNRQEQVQNALSLKNDTKTKKKVFTEIFIEEINGDLNILTDIANNIEKQEADEKTIRQFLKSCASLQSSAQLFEYEKISEFISFVIDVIEDLVLKNYKAAENIIPFFKQLPNIVHGLVSNDQKVLDDARTFLEKVTEIVEDINSNGKEPGSSGSTIDEDIISSPGK